MDKRGVTNEFKLNLIGEGIKINLEEQSNILSPDSYRSPNVLSTGGGEERKIWAALKDHFGN